MEVMGLKEGGEKRRGIVENRLMKVERRIETRERKGNIIIKVMEVKESKRREAVEEVLKTLGVKEDMKEFKKLEGEKRKNGETLLVKLKGEK